MLSQKTAYLSYIGWNAFIRLFSDSNVHISSLGRSMPITAKTYLASLVESLLIGFQSERWRFVCGLRKTGIFQKLVRAFNRLLTHWEILVAETLRNSTNGTNDIRILS